jgi:hypothetical protein
MQDTEKEGQKFAPDEIDLVGLFIRSVRFFYNNRYIFLFCTILAACGTAGYMYFKPKVYQSRFTAECMSIPDSRTIELINDLEGLRNNKDWNLLGVKLGMKPDRAKLIKKIEPLSTITIDKEAKGVDDYLLSTAETSYKFSIIALVKNNSVLPELQKGIIKYLSANEYSSLRVNRFIENRKSLLSYVNYELKKLDSLNSLYADKIVHSSSSTSLTSPGDFKATVISLQEKKLAIEDELKFAAPVRVIQGFTAFKDPVEPILTFVILISLAISYALGLLFIMIRFLTTVYSQNKSKYI